jgi:hypothetical protein
VEEFGLEQSARQGEEERGGEKGRKEEGGRYGLFGPQQHCPLQLFFEGEKGIKERSIRRERRGRRKEEGRREGGRTLAKSTGCLKRGHSWYR